MSDAGSRASVRTRRRRGWDRERGVLVAVALGALLAPLNSTMIAVALPEIVEELDTSVATAGWLVTTYLLALAVVQPVAGKVGDRIGRRPLVLGGLAVFGAASLGAALAPTLAVLIAFRVTQAVAGAVVFPNGSGLIRALVPADRRGGAFGIVGGSVALAAGLGPLVGGALIAVGGWRAIFVVNVPVVLAALLIARRSVPRERPSPPETPFDQAGALLLALVLGGSALVVVEGVHAPVVAAAGGVALGVLAVVLVRVELRRPDPVLQPRFFRVRAFAAANGAIAASNLAFYTVLIAVPILLAGREGWSSLQVGLGLAALSAPMVVCSPLGGRLADTQGRRAPALAGCVALAVGVAPLVLRPDLAPSVLLPCLALMGAGVGLSMAGLQASAIEALDARDAGVAAGVFSTSRYVGSFAGSLALARLVEDDSLDGFRAVFALALAGALVAVVVASALPGRPSSLAVAPEG